MQRHRHVALVVEDDAHIRELIVEFLRDEAFTVDAAEDGGEALRFIDDPQHAYCAVLLDLMLPQVSGVDVLRHLRTVDSAVPVIAMSASRDHLAVAIRAGATLAIPKPFDIEDVLSMMNRHCPRERPP
jgi:DNA-binding response OmpR family regulator